MTPIGRGELQCLNCKTWSPSLIDFGTKENFENSAMTRASFDCPNCGKTVPYGLENMRWVQSDGRGGFVGGDTR